MASEAEVVRALQEGGLACFPTETVWSLSARADDPSAVARIFHAKGRPGGVPLAIGFPAWEDCFQDTWPTAGADALAARFLPGPLSLVVERRTERFAHCAPGLDSISIRIPDHPVAQRILRATGPLVMTSANRHGEADPITSGDVARVFPGVPVLEAATVPGTASTVVDCTQERTFRVLREGVITEAEVAAAWP